MLRRIRFALALAITTAVAPTLALSQAATLKLSWDQCAGDGLIADRSFACNTNTGQDVLVASVVFNDGITRTGVLGIEGYVDFRFTSTTTPAWWQTRTGECRANLIHVDYGPFAASEHCASWFQASSPDEPVVVTAIESESGIANGWRFRLAAGLLAPATLPPGQELIVFRITIPHTKTIGSGACAGCQTPTCIGFGNLNLDRHPSPTEQFVGTPASTVTWQGAYVAGYNPIAAHQEGPGFVVYHGNLSCATGPVPVQGRTWGMIKTLYR